MKNKKFLIICIIAVVLIAIDGVIFLLQNIEQVKRATLLEDEKVLETITIDNTKEDNEENAEDIIGYLTIKSIGLEKAPIREGTEDSILEKAIGHFSETSYLEGNVCLAAHNRGYEHNYFENLKNIKEKDLITYTTKNEEKNYEVVDIEKIKEEDVNVLENTKENRITLITCVENEPQFRLCIIANECKEVIQ